ncbi:hypothetical protein ACQPWY_10600 [Pseudonocardia xinjiangensis]|uniref:hypothetical protein n=1 Tax=Pseudonocardia xinjiangensis TaxID=75289 RepID=UPI003D8A6F10
MPRWVDVVRRDNPPPDDESPTTFVRVDDIPTTYVPVVTASTSPPPAPQTWIRRMAPWAAFGVVAVVVVAGTTAWSASLRGPEDSLGAGAPTLAQVPALAPATPEPTPESTTAAQEETSAARATRERARTTARATPSTVPPPAPGNGGAPPAVQPQAPSPPAPTSAATTTTPRVTRPPLFPQQAAPTCTPGRPNGSGAPCTAVPPTSRPR